MKSTFENLGFFKEFYINKKFVGQIETENDRSEIGYVGRVIETINESIKLSNGKSIKKGTEVMTVIYPLCGKHL